MRRHAAARRHARRRRCWRTQARGAAANLALDTCRGAGPARARLRRRPATRPARHRRPGPPPLDAVARGRWPQSGAGAEPRRRPAPAPAAFDPAARRSAPAARCCASRCGAVSSTTPRWPSWAPRCRPAAGARLVPTARRARRFRLRAGAAAARRLLPCSPPTDTAARRMRPTPKTTPAPLAGRRRSRPTCNCCAKFCKPTTGCCLPPTAPAPCNWPTGAARPDLAGHHDAGHGRLRGLPSAENRTGHHPDSGDLRHRADRDRRRSRGFDFGAVDYITKPVSPPIVRARVRTHLSLVRMDELRATPPANRPMPWPGRRIQRQRNRPPRHPHEPVRAATGMAAG